MICPNVSSVSTRVRSKYSIQTKREDLELELLSANGASVVLILIKWTHARLVNGDLGLTEQIVYTNGTLPPKPPTYVLVRFDKYVGVPWD